MNIHIWTGFLAIVFFWGIVLFRKGSSLHRKMGVFYFFTIAMLSISSIVNTFIILILPKLYNAEIGPQYVYGYYPFLFLGTFLCLTPSFVAVIVFFKKPETIIILNRIAMCILFSQIIFAIAVAIYSIFKLNIFLFSFSTAFTGYSVYRDNKNIKNLRQNGANLAFPERFKIHLNSVIASGLALHIGFAAGGFSIRFLKNTNSPLHFILLTSTVFIFMYFFEIKIYKSLLQKYSSLVKDNSL